MVCMYPTEHNLGSIIRHTNIAYVDDFVPRAWAPRGGRGIGRGGGGEVNQGGREGGREAGTDGGGEGRKKGRGERKVGRTGNSPPRTL